MVSGACNPAITVGSAVGQSGGDGIRDPGGDSPADPMPLTAGDTSGLDKGLLEAILPEAASNA
jgi:hypothetical protein